MEGPIPAGGGEGRRTPDLPDGAALALLLLGTAYVFGASGGFSFVNYDDGPFVYANPVVKGGLSAEGLRWALATFHRGAWHPLAWLSHMADVSLFGLDAGRHHLVSAALHAVSSFLLYLAFRAMTGAPWRSLAVALLFAVHPLHVESVAWVAERKDVLCALFWNGSLLAYAAYARRGGAARYGALLLLFSLALLSKPMAVTLPAVLLLLDFWPLGRLRLPGEEGGVPWRRLLLEKVPLLALSGAAAAVTVLALGDAGEAAAGDTPPGGRLLEAASAAVSYLAKTLWPARLAVFYPRPSLAGLPDPAWKGVGALLLLAAATAGALALGRRRRHLPAGWLWYLGTLLPVSGIVRMGAHAMADRYTYLPLVGIFAAAAWSVPEPRGGWDRKRLAAAAAAGALVVLPLAEAARRQASAWRDGETLFRRAVSVTERNYVALSALGAALAVSGRVAEGVPHIEESLRIHPRRAVTWMDLGDGRMALGDPAAALPCYERAVALEPGNGTARYKAGTALAALGRREEALARMGEATAAEPTDPDLWYNLGVTFLGRGDGAGAERALREALRLRPAFSEAANNLGVALAMQGRGAEAEGAFREALRLSPGNAEAARNLAELPRRFDGTAPAP